MIKENITDLLFLDIETAPEYASFQDVPDKMKLLWEKKTVNLRKENDTPESIYGRAGIWAEFGRIICICCGYIALRGDKKILRVKSFYDDDERAILQGFADLVQNFFKLRPYAALCAHNGKEFDMPYIARRMIINKMNLIPQLRVQGKKPWEVPFADTMELWKFGDYKHFCSLDLLSEIMGLPTPKDDIDGGKVAEVYYTEKNIERIVTYCIKDVTAVANLMLRYMNEDPIDETVEV